MSFANQDISPNRNQTLGMQLLKWEWLILAMLLPVALVPRPQLLPLLAIIPIFWLIRKITYKRFFPRSLFTIPLLLLGVMILVSAWATPDFEFSLGKVVGLFYGIGLFFAVTFAARQSRKALQLTVVALYLSQLLVVAISLVGTTWARKIPLLGQLSARIPKLPIPGAETGFNPNQVAGVLIWIVPLAVAIAVMVLVKWSKLSRRMSLSMYSALVTATGLFALLFLGMLALTQSRGAFLGFAASLFVMGLMLLGKLRWPILAVTAVIGFGGWFYSTQQETTLVDRLYGNVDAGQALASGVNSFDSRVEIWSRAIYAIQDFPFTGMGMNMFRRIVHILYPLFTIAPSTDLGHAHNHFLQTAVDLGIPGLIAYMALFIGAFIMIYQIWKRGDFVMRTLAVGICGSLVGYLGYGMLDAVSLGAKPGFIFWLLLAILAATHSLTLREAGVTPRKRKCHSSSENLSKS